MEDEKEGAEPLWAVRRLSYADTSSGWPHLGSPITSRLGVDLRVELTPPYSKLAIALALRAALNACRRGLRVAIRAPSNITSIVRNGLEELGCSSAMVGSCEDVPLPEADLYIVLWCGLESLREHLERVVFAAGVNIPSRSGIRRLHARMLGGNLYLLMLRGAKREREYVVVNGLTLSTVEPPCPAELISELCEFAVAGRISVRDAVDVIAHHYGVRKAEARSILLSLASKGCVEVSQADKMVYVYC